MQYILYIYMYIIIDSYSIYNSINLLLYSRVFAICTPTFPVQVQPI